VPWSNFWLTLTSPASLTIRVWRKIINTRSSRVTYFLHSNESYGWHFQYLTILGLALATSTFTAGLLADITLSPRLFLLKNILSVCSAPMEVLISVLWWTISSVRFIIGPLSLSNCYRSTEVWSYRIGLYFLFMQVRVIPQSLPQDLNVSDIGFHAMPSLILTIDLLFLSPPWTITIWPAMGLSSVIAFGYWFWVELCRSHNGWYVNCHSGLFQLTLSRYPYPLFDQLDTPLRLGLFTLSAAVMAMNTAALRWLYGRVNGW
jgi:hypothetical protein